MNRSDSISNESDKKTNQLGSVDPWKTTAEGIGGIDYQRSAQITWWSILQGIAVGALVLSIPTVFDKVAELGQWYLLCFVIASFLIIVNVWVQMAWSILILRWELSLLHTFLILLLGVAVSTSCIFVTNPPIWALSIAGLVVCAIAVYVYNIEKRAYIGLSTKRVKRIIGLYCAFLLMCIVAYSHMKLAPSDLVLTMWGFTFMIAALISVFVQDKQMRYEQKKRNIA